MKTKTSKRPKHSKSAIQLKDIKATKNPKGGVTKPGSDRSNVFAVWLTTG